MSPTVVGVIGLVIFLVIMFLGMPIAFSFLMVGFIGIAALRGYAGLSVLGTLPYTWASMWTIVCLPLFILMGNFAFHGGIAKDLFDTAYKWVGRLPGGLALATDIACTGFAACSGSSVASAATLGAIAIPEMRRFHYKDTLATGCVASGGTIAPMIPPSILFIVYGVVTQTSIACLLMAGILPGLLMAGAFALTIFVICILDPAAGPRGESFSWREKFVSLKGTWGMLVLMLLIIGGLYAGIFTPSEAGAVGAFGAFIVVLCRGKMTLSSLIAALKDTAQTTSFVLLIVIGVSVFSIFLSLSGVTTIFSTWILGLNLPPHGTLAIILLMYVPLGMVVESMPMMLITLPWVFPIITALGFDPIWFGVLLLVMTELSLISPPVAMNLYVVHQVSGVPLKMIWRGIFPFILVLIVIEVILVAFPQISLFIPGLMK